MEGKDLIVNEYLQGASVQDLAKKYSVSREAIYLRLRTMPDWRKVSKVQKKERKKDKIKRQREQVLKLAEEGLSVNAIRKELNLANKTVSEFLEGTKYDRRREVLRHRDAEAKKLRALGWKRKKLCERYGIKERQLDKILKRKEK